MALSNSAIIGIGGIGVLLVGFSAFAKPTPLVIYNPSSSEPKGFYRLSALRPAPGRLIAFRVPRPGAAYAASHIPYVARTAILKEIAVGQGSNVCVRGGEIWIAGQPRAHVATKDHNGALLPHWLGCRKLAAREYFVFSNRISNSYDSRYYGPVPASDIVGVYQPLWTE